LFAAPELLPDQLAGFLQDRRWLANGGVACEAEIEWVLEMARNHNGVARLAFIGRGWRLGLRRQAWPLLPATGLIKGPVFA
jgi:hypothetical protein